MCMCEQVGGCIRQIVDEHSGAALCGDAGVFGHIGLNRVLAELVLVMVEVDERE